MKKERLLVLCGTIILALIVASVPVMVGCAAPAPPTPTPTLPERLTFAALSMGTAFYATASGLAKVMSDNSPMTVVVSPFTGPQAWVSTMNESGTPEIGIETLPIVWQMWTGKAAPEPLPEGFPPEAPYPRSSSLRILMTGTTLHVGMLVREDSGMTTIEDLRGKRIAWEWSGFPQGIPITLGNLLNGGLTLSDVKTAPMTEVVSAVRAVTENRIDSTMCAVGMGAVSEADALVGVRFLQNSMDPERIKAGQRAYPGAYSVLVAPGPAGVHEETAIWSAPIAIFASVHMSDDVAYALVETWWEHHQELWPIHPVLKGWAPELFVNKYATMPYHDGAVRFYKEKGIWDAEMEQIQEQLLKGG